MTRHLGARPGSPAGALDADGFTRLYQGAAPNLWTLAAAILGDRVQAEDVLQEACVIALDKLDQFEPGTHFHAWMGRIVRNVALNHLRKRSPSGRSMPPETMDERWTASGEAAPGHGTIPVLDAAEADVEALVDLGPDQPHFDDAVVAALRELSPVARACLVLRSVRKLDYKELSDVLGIPRGTAMSHVHRARAVLRERLRGWPDSIETVTPATGQRGNPS